MLEEYILYIDTLFDEHPSSDSSYILKLLKRHIKQNHYNLIIDEENTDEALAEIEELKLNWLERNCN